jgi:hypothetical protein
MAINHSPQLHTPHNSHDQFPECAQRSPIQFRISIHLSFPICSHIYSDAISCTASATGFLRVFRFPLPILIPLTAPDISHLVKGSTCIVSTDGIVEKSANATGPI